MEYLALEDGSPGFPQSCMFRGTQVSSDREGYVSVRGCHPLWLPFPRHSCTSKSLRRGHPGPPSRPYNPAVRNALRLTRKRFRLFPFRSPLLRESLLLSFPGVTKMFQFAPFPSCTYVFSTG